MQSTQHVLADKLKVQGDLRKGAVDNNSSLTTGSGYKKIDSYQIKKWIWTWFLDKFPKPD